MKRLYALLCASATGLLGYMIGSNKICDDSELSIIGEQVTYEEYMQPHDSIRRQPIRAHSTRREQHPHCTRDHVRIGHQSSTHDPIEELFQEIRKEDRARIMESILNARKDAREAFLGEQWETFFADLPSADDVGFKAHMQQLYAILERDRTPDELRSIYMCMVESWPNISYLDRQRSFFATHLCSEERWAAANHATVMDQLAQSYRSMYDSTRPLLDPSEFNRFSELSFYWPLAEQNADK